MKTIIGCMFLLLAAITAAPAQHHFSNWVYRDATDTTLVRCWNDTLSAVSFPANCMGMGMMYPESLYCQFEFLPLDSLHHPVDSTFLCWRRLQLGSDSIHFGYLHCDTGYGDGQFMMGFQRGIACSLHWDSLQADSMHRTWQPTGVRCWNGTSWVTPSYTSIDGNTITMVTSNLYAAVAIVGEPKNVTSVSYGPGAPSEFLLEQNYPNPFNPSTTFKFDLAIDAHVVLAVYNTLGQEIVRLLDDNRRPGHYSLSWKAETVPSGLYYARMVVVDDRGIVRYTVTRKALLMR